MERQYHNLLVSEDSAGQKEQVFCWDGNVAAKGLNFQEYEEGMSGGYAVLLVISPGRDYHWYRQEADGTWSHKPGSYAVETGVIDPIADARKKKYTSIVGYYYITEVCDID